MEIGEVENLVAEIEVRLERMRSLYSQYFAGIEKLEPSVVRKDFDRRMEVLRKMQIRNTGLRFRFQMVVQRYNTYQTYWLRICRQIENGTYKRDLRRARERFESDLPPPLVALPPAPQAETVNAPVAAAAKPADTRPAKPPARDAGIFELSDGFDLDLSLDEAFDRVNVAPAPRIVAAPPVGSGAPVPPPLPARAMPPPRPAAASASAASAPPPPRVSMSSLDAPDFGASVRPPSPSSPSFSPAAITTMSGAVSAGGAGDKPAAKRIVITRSAAPGAVARPSGSPPGSPAGGTLPPSQTNAPGAAPPLPPRDVRPAASAAPAAASAPAAPSMKPAPAPPAVSAASVSGRGESAPPARASAPGTAPPFRPAVTGAPPRKDEPGGLPDERVRQIYARYVDTKRANGESTAAVTYDALAKSLRDSSVKLRDKVGAGKNIDFEVAVKDGKTILKPVVK